MTKQLSCQRRGCGKYYLVGSTAEDCCYHSGTPVFHDALKGWSCCDKKVVDFDAFLKIPGCSFGRHSSEPLPKSASSSVQDQDTPAAVKSGEIAEKVPVPKMGETFQTSLPFQGKTQTTPQTNPAKKVSESDLDDKADAMISPGTKCKRPSCGQTFGNETEICVFHTGSPVFHEGSKGWSCCSRKVLEFDEFLKIKGCKNGRHRFTAGRDGPVVVECKKDWYQTQDTVIISIFAKKIKKEVTKIAFKESQLSADVVFEDGSIFPYHPALFQPIVPQNCTFEIFSSKIEIKLAKSNGISWPAIEAGVTVSSFTTFGLQGTGGGSVGSKVPEIATDSCIHLLQKGT